MPHEPDDPPLLMTFGNNMKLPSEMAGHGIHHPVHGARMKEKADKLNVECHLLIDSVTKSGEYKSDKEFLSAILLPKGKR